MFSLFKPWRDDLETLLAAVEASPEYAYEKRIAELEHQLAALSPSPTAPTVEEVARAHWDSERETLRERSGGWFDAGPWEEADPDTRTMRLSAAARIIELFQGKAR